MFNETIAQEVILTTADQVITNPFEQVQKHPETSEKYSFLSTADIREVFESLGFNFEEINRKKSRKAHLKGYEKHAFCAYGGSLLPKTELLALRDVPRIIGINSHSSKAGHSSAFLLKIGYFRRVCENGLLVSEDIFPAIRLIHKGLTKEKVVNAILLAVSRYRQVEEYMETLRATKPTQEQMLEYAHKMTMARLTMASHNVEVLSIDNINDVLQVRREEDSETTWWNLINVVQENLIGKPVELNYTVKTLDKENREVTKQKTKRSGLRSMDSTMGLNQLCFSVANEIIGITGNQVEADAA